MVLMTISYVQHDESLYLSCIPIHYFGHMHVGVGGVSLIGKPVKKTSAYLVNPVSK